jgi:hypothetical protein
MKVLKDKIQLDSSKWPYLEEGEKLVGVFARYQNNRIALALHSWKAGGFAEPYATATVNLPDAFCPDGCAYIKDYSESAGMVRRLIEEGVIEPEPVESATSGFVSIKCYKFTKEMKGVI